MRRRRRRSDCPIHFGLEVFGDPWSLLIVRDLMFKGHRTYTEFLRGEERIATNVLADRLARLEQDGILATERDPITGRAVRYQLTAKGVDLVPMMLEVIGWSAKHDPHTAADPDFVTRLSTDRHGLERDLRRELEPANTVPAGPQRQRDPA
jgi:DNA-binding HxlR family transcriptional regulator